MTSRTTLTACSMVTMLVMTLVHPLAAGPLRSDELDQGLQSFTQGFSALQEILASAAKVFQAIIKIKTETVLPALQATARAGQAIINSPAIRQIKQTKQSLAQTFSQTAPVISGVLNGFAGQAGGLANTFVNGATCTFVCPFQPDDQQRQLCTSRSCNGFNSNTNAPASSSTSTTFIRNGSPSISSSSPSSFGTSASNTRVITSSSPSASSNAIITSSNEIDDDFSQYGEVEVNQFG